MASNQQSYKAGETRGKAQTGEAIKNKAQDAAQYTKETAEAGKDKTGDFLSQTGEHVKQMAMGAADTVQHALGMATNEEGKEHIPGSTTTTTAHGTTDPTHQTYHRK